jgi:hypothetical protein
MAIGLYVWWLAPVLGFLSIGLSLFIGDKSLFVVASYRDALPTLYFLCATSAAVACAEAAEFFLMFDRSKHDARLADRAASLLFANILAAITWACTYAKLQADVSAGRLTVTLLSLSLAVVFTLVTVASGFVIKSDLEAIKKQEKAS